MPAANEGAVVRDIDYFMSEEHADEFGKLTEAQQAELYLSGSLQVEGDTAAQAAGTSEAPAAETSESSQAAPAVGAAAEEPVVLTKDGKHTIPFKELEDAREKARHFEQLAAEQKTLLDDLAKAKEKDAETGGTEAQQAVLAEYSGEFPEVAEDMKPYIQAMIAEGVKTGVSEKLAEFEEKLNKVVAPIQKAETDTAIEDHFKAIRDAHSDFDAIAKGDTLEKWIETQPSFMRPALQDVLNKGDATQVIELVTAYKKDVGEPAATVVPPAGKLTAQQVAEAAIAKAAEGGTPRSLGDFPGAGSVHVNEAEAMMNMGPDELARKFEGKTSEQIMQLMSRLV